MTLGLPLLLCTGGIYGVFFISPMSDIPSPDALRKVRGQISKMNYERGDSPNIQFYIVGIADPFLIRSDMGVLAHLATRLDNAHVQSQAIAVAYTTRQHNLIQGQIMTVNHPWQIDILASNVGTKTKTAPVESQLLSYDNMVQVQKEDNQDMHWLGVLALLSGVTSLISVLYRLRRAAHPQRV